MYVCMYVTGFPSPLTIEWVVACAGGMEPWSSLGEWVEDPFVATQQTDRMSAHTRSLMTAWGHITLEL